MSFPRPWMNQKSEKWAFQALGWIQNRENGLAEVLRVFEAGAYLSMTSPIPVGHRSYTCRMVRRSGVSTQNKFYREYFNRDLSDVCLNPCLLMVDEVRDS